jgi:hypothetical protein
MISIVSRPQSQGACHGSLAGLAHGLTVSPVEEFLAQLRANDHGTRGRQGHRHRRVYVVGPMGASKHINATNHRQFCVLNFYRLEGE